MESLNENYYYNLDLNNLINNDLTDQLGSGQIYSKILKQYYPDYSNYFDDDLITVYKQPTKELVRDLKSLLLYISVFLSDNSKNNVMFLTVNPSREFIYAKHGKLLSGAEQFAYLLNSLKATNLHWCSISVEQGNTRIQSRFTMYHYHIILCVPHKSNYKAALNIKSLRSYFTCMHKVTADHFQSAVKVSPTDYSRLRQGVEYFYGFSQSSVNLAPSHGGNSRPKGGSCSPRGSELVRKDDHLFSINVT